MLAGTVRWQFVTGPISALIATLAGYQIQAPCVHSWLLPDGKKLAFNFRQPASVYVRMISNVCKGHYWEQASQHYCGLGLTSLGPHPSSFALHKNWTKDSNKRVELGMLECVLSGTGWCPERVALCWPEVDPACPRCLAPICDVFLMFYG